MANKNFDDLKSLVAYAKNDIKKTMQTKVLEVVKEVEIKHIQEDVLDAYTPEYYKRRESGGIDDPNNIVGVVTEEGSEINLNVTNNTLAVGDRKGEYLDEIIEEGVSPYGYPYSKPRPFLENTEEELGSSGIIEKIIKAELDYVD